MTTPSSGTKTLKAFKVTLVGRSGREEFELPRASFEKSPHVFIGVCWEISWKIHDQNTRKCQKYSKIPIKFEITRKYPKYSKLPENTRKYSKLPEIFEITRKYAKYSKLPEITRNYLKWTKLLENYPNYSK